MRPARHALTYGDKTFTRVIAKTQNSRTINVNLILYNPTNTMNYEGKIIKLLPEETVGKNNLRKQTIVLEEINDREWKGGLVVDFFNDKIDLVK
jgi:hypothetical protein